MKKEIWNEIRISDQINKVFIVTGPTSGLGKETLRILSKKNATVIMAARDIKRAESVKNEMLSQNKNGKIDIQELDLSSLESINNFSKAIKKKYKVIDVLINNAGIMACPYSKTKDGFEIQMGTNHLGHFALTGLLLPLLQKQPNSRIVNVSSGAHFAVKRINFDDIQSINSYKPFKVYGYSKLANILFTKKLSDILKNDDVTVNCLHPGVVATGFASQNNSKLQKFIFGLAKPFMRTSDNGAKTSVYLCSSSDVSNISGEYFYNSKISKTSNGANNSQDADRLWDISLQLTGLI